MGSIILIYNLNFFTLAVTWDMDMTWDSCSPFHDNDKKKCSANVWEQFRKYYLVQNYIPPPLLFTGNFFIAVQCTRTCTGSFILIIDLQLQLESFSEIGSNLNLKRLFGNLWDFILINARNLNG